MAELFVFATEPISLSDLAGRAGTSLGGAHKEVERLEASGLVSSTTVGRNRLIAADETSPLYPELRGLLLKTAGPEPLLRAALADIDGIREAFIFGSWADPAQRSPADIDVLVIGDPDVGEVYDAVSAIEADLGRSRGGHQHRRSHPRGLREDPLSPPRRRRVFVGDRAIRPVLS